MNLTNLPTTPWVYIFKNHRNTILYIGKAKNLVKRVSQYFTPGSVWKQDMISKAARVDFIEVTTESEALYLEDNLIKQHNPEYNRLLKWDNSYIYLKITKEDFPQLYLTRMRKNDGARYIWPKNNTGDLKKLMHYLRQIYKYRTMKSTEFRQGKLSSDFYFGLDKGRSVIAKYAPLLERGLGGDQIIEKLKNNWLILDKSYAEYKEEYKQIVRSIASFFEGNTKEVKQRILTDINEAIEKQHFERCINLRNILEQIDQRTEKQHVVLAPQHTGSIIRITAINNFRVIIMIKIFEGKMTDVIREKKSKEDRSLNQMTASLEADFWPMSTPFSKGGRGDLNNTTWSSPTLLSKEGEITLISNSLKKLSKSDQTEVDTLLNKFLESYIASTTFDLENNLTQELLQQLQNRYHLTKFPYQIECIDISHLSGSYISGWLSCMREWLLYKAGYRHYKIKTLESSKGNYSNDFLSLQEIIVRRFNLKKGKVIANDSKTTHNKDTESPHSSLLTAHWLPDLFILDWGKAQLSILIELCAIFPQLIDIMKTTTFIALGKWKARKESAKSKGESEQVYYFKKEGDNWELIIDNYELLYDPADRLLTKLRDEAHRFANKYRTTRMGKEWK